MYYFLFVNLIVVVRKLMAPDEIQKIEQMTEDDNPVIVKYYLKK